MKEIIDWLGSRPIHFIVFVIGFCACCFFFTNSCARVFEADYKYRIEREKALSDRFR
jgi:F0F1-type ATP synthase assembly protein I